MAVSSAILQCTMKNDRSHEYWEKYRKNFPLEMNLECVLIKKRPCLLSVHYGRFSYNVSQLERRDLKETGFYHMLCNFVDQ